MKGGLWGGGGAAFIFSAPHIIFIVNKTHLAFLSEQGLAGEASFHREREREAAGERGGEQRVKAKEMRGGWNKGSREAGMMKSLAGRYSGKEKAKEKKRQ